VTLWQSVGLDMPISINIPAYHFLHAGFIASIEAQLAQYPAGMAMYLIFELVETAALEDINAVSRVVSRLAKLGIECSLDDFGTGYSSLVHLKRLTVSELKIDQTFIRDILLDPGDLAIAQGVIGLAAAFHQRVVAEGVESTEQILLLLELGCPVMQGYGIARPQPAEQFLQWAQQFVADPRWRISSGGYPSRGNFELLLVEVALRLWLTGWAAWQMGTDNHPSCDPAQSRFSLWYRQSGQLLKTKLADLNRIEQQHHQLYRLAQQMLQAGDCQNQVLLATLRNDLSSQGDETLASLRQLRQMLSRNPSTSLSLL
jgi:hypothetical protein